MKIKMVISTLVFVMFSAAFVFAQDSKGHLMPSAAKEIESMATNQDGMVSITESGKLPAEAKYNCNNDAGSVGVSFTRNASPDDAKGLQMISDMIHGLVASGQPVDGEKMTETSVDGARVFYYEKTEGCIESVHPSRQIISVTAYWIGSDRTAQIGTQAVSLDSAKKYIHEVIERSKALVPAKVKSS